MDATLYNIKGEKAGKVTIPENIFGLPWNADLVHQVVVSMQSNARMGNAHTKDRGEVRGGGKKPWAQKGTGRARHGSSRSPIWKGGGVTHGPSNETVFKKSISKQMRQKALLVTLSRKFKDGEILFVDSLEMAEPKTKNAKVVLAALAKEFAGLASKKNAALIALPSAHKPTMKSFSNFGNIETMDVRNLNPVAVLSVKYLVIANPEVAFETLGAKKVASAKGKTKK
ncbi:MAG: 50S ribosomal protein L4 [Patescibacteria group bacterium]